jgi:hypothetical protein
MNKLLILASALFVTACTSSGAQNTLADADDQNLVCEYIAKTGSNMKKKTCMTRALAEELERETREDLNEAYRSGRTQTTTM